MTDVAEASPLPAIPTSTMEAALLHLRRPFTPGAVKWKVQITGPKNEKEKTWATVVGYIDARLVIERLNAVVAGQWHEEPSERFSPTLLRYKLTVLGQTHTDIGEGRGDNDGMKAKATDSDALKRVAVRFGIGAFLYAMPPFSLYITPSGEMKDDKPTLKRMKSGKAGYLKEAHEAWLREEYQRWLDSEGIAHFGAPLDHGDAHAGSVGGLIDVLPGADSEDTPIELQPAALEDAEAFGLRDRIANAFEALVAVNPDRLAPGRYEKMVADAAHSHVELERVAVALENLRYTEETLAERRAQLIKLMGAKTAKPLIESAERRGSQQERIDALDKAISAAPSEGS